MVSSVSPLDNRRNPLTVPDSRGFSGTRCGQLEPVQQGTGDVSSREACAIPRPAEFHAAVRHTLPPSDIVLHALALVALAAQAMTAALAAGRRSMDWVGVCLLGRITALGGGSIRDVLLGHYPLVWVQSPSLLALTGGAAFATIL